MKTINYVSKVMGDNKYDQQDNHDVINNCIIFIIGLRTMQNDIIKYFIENQVGARCAISANIDILFHTNNDYDHEIRIGLWDFQSTNLQNMFADLKYYRERTFQKTYIALFNVSTGFGVEDKCIRKGIRGFFYEDNTLEQFQSGIHKIINGGLFVSRKIMAEYILKIEDQNRISEVVNKPLTLRQMEILKLLSRGASNKDISEKLCISPNTVKAHLYGIFQTINVSSRLQAATWVANNLHG